MGYKTKEQEKQEQALMEEGFPKSLYHKNFDANGDEKNLLANYKLVKNRHEEERLGKDWGPHPLHKGLDASHEAVEEKPKTVIKTKVKAE